MLHFAMPVQACQSLFKMHEWTHVTLFFCFKSNALVDKSGTDATGFARAPPCTIASGLGAFLGVDVLAKDPFSRKGDVSGTNNAVVSAKYIVIYQSSP